MKKLERVAQAVAFVILLLTLYSTVLQQPLFFVSVRSDSMAPLLQTGDIVLTLPAALHPPEVGDIVLFEPRPGFWVIHRIVGGDAESGFVAKGDANQLTDQEGSGFPLLQPSSVVAVAPTVGDQPLKLPLAGLISRYLQDYSGGPNLLPVLLLLAAMLALLWPTSPRSAPGWRSGLPLLPMLSVAIAGILAIFMTTQSVTIPLGGDPGPVAGSTSPTFGGIPAQLDPRPSLRLENDAPVPLLFSLSTDGLGPVLSPGWLLLWPGESGEITIVPDNSGGADPGTAELQAAALLPLLPPSLLHRLAGRSPWLAMALSALLPVLPLFLLDELLARTGRRPLLRLSR